MDTNYYQDSSFINVLYIIDLSLISHFSTMLFSGDQTRVIYSSNDYAFRKRSDNNVSNLNLPFMNFRLKSHEVGERIRWNLPSNSQGVFIDQLDAKIRFSPILLNYEASIWFHRDFDIKYAFNEIIWDSDNKTLLRPYATVTNTFIPETPVEVDIEFPAHLGYTGPSLDPEYNEKDWLEKNNIHSATIDFEIQSFALKTNTDITIPTDLLFNFATHVEPIDDNYLEALTFTINHLTEEVE